MDLHDTGIGVETVYGTHEDSHMVMSEKVQSLAGSIYQEFERMIARYDEDVVKTLMPLLVNVLECLDAAYQSNQEQDVELELLREDNEQLVTQYEREKVARKNSEQKLLEFEDASEGERKEFLARQEALESIARMLELKHKNSMEHAGRLEEREAELKKEYAKLHERYTDLFKTHMDYMERTKLLLSGGQLANERSESSRLAGNRLNIGRSSGPVSFGFASLENAEGIDSVPTSPISSTHSSPSLHSELDNAKEGLRTVEKGLETDMISLENKGVVTSPLSPQATPLHNNNSGAGRVKKEQRSGNTLYQELSFQDSDALCDDDGTDQITGGWVHPGEYASSVNDNFYGMGKEVENLIMENNELLATKNALNVVKDDLIVQVDALAGELEMLREEILSLNMSRTRQRERIADLEEELKKLKETQEVKQENNEEESEVPMAQRKRFTRVEMARVLMERNQYKERFMELQEAVRWSELMRAHKQGPELKNKQSVWKYFMNLFSAERPTSGNDPHSMIRFQTGTNQVTPGVRNLPARTQDFPETEMGSLAKQRERREQYRHVRAHVKKEDGRLTAYGWSLPDKSAGLASRGPPNMSGVPVPVPVYCRPLEESSSGMKIWCAAGVNLQGGYTKDGGLMVGGSVFYSDEAPLPPPPTKAANELDTLDKELDAAKEASRLETKLSSLVWICTSMRAASIVTVIDANNPAEILNSFGVCAHHVLCIASVPGASPDDYSDNKYIIPPEEAQPDLTQNEEKAEEFTEEEVFPDYGKITYVDDNKTVKNKRVQIENAKLEQQQETAAEEATSGAVSSDSTAETIDTSCGSEAEATTTHEVMSSALSTMWLGAQNGEVFVHSSVASWNQCLHSVQLADAVLNIVHVSGRVICALANGTMVVFSRDDSGEWDLTKYNVIQIGCAYHSIRCLAVVADKVWCGYRNKVSIMDPISLKLVHNLTAHPRKESQVRQFAWHGDGVWLSVRLDSTLRLYHAQTYEHMQDVDIEPYVSKMLGAGKLGFSLVRISALLISSNRLWIGTSNGVIISVPLSDSHQVTPIIVNARSWRPAIESASRVSYSNPLIPFCNVAHAQLSFHGHRDSVKFFVAVPGNGGMSAASTPSEAHSAGVSPMSAPSKPPPAMLVMSGGEGYIDFRIGESEMDESMVGNESGDLEGGHSEQRDEKSHLIVWQPYKMADSNGEEVVPVVPFKKPNLEDKKDSIHDDLKDLSKFTIDQVLSSNATRKTITLKGTFAGTTDIGIVVLEKTAFDEIKLREEDYLGTCSLKQDFHNDIYGNYQCFPKAELNTVKTTVIHPATEKHIKQYGMQIMHMVNETPAIYKDIIEPDLQDSSQFSLQWVYNILEHTSEQDRILFEDPDPTTGFILLPDLKWDGKTVETLHLLALPHLRGLKSLRDLTGEHLPLLKHIYKSGTKTICDKFGVQASRLRIYLHYQPSFYHLHVHFSSLSYDTGGIFAEKCHLLANVISNIELVSDYYQRVTLPYAVRENDNRFKKLEDKGFLKKVVKETDKDDCEKSSD